MASPEKEHYWGKYAFECKFADFCNREFYRSEEINYEQFKAIAKNGKVICKPIGGEQGKGIQVFEVGSDANAAFSKVKELENYIVEEWIIQHPCLNEIYPDSVNPVRIQTLVKDNKVEFAGATLTIGNGKKFANASSDALFAIIDVNTGKVITDACNFDTREVYKNHPISNVNFKEIIIPYWEEIMSLTKKAALTTPTIVTVGWDVAISDNGPVIIEGNIGPGYMWLQLPLLTGKHEGNKSVFKPYLK